ncbi:MAG: type II toxin-antitoxin system HicB family antitoxin [Patescibacteria group bacterium]
MKARVQINVPVSYFKEDKSFIAYTPALDLSSAGKTLKEAEKNITEAVGIFMEEILEHGTIDEVLPSLGWKKILRTKQWTPPIFVSHGILPVTM